MKAAVAGEQGVEVRDVPLPEPKASEVLVRVRASSLNRADLQVASGRQHGSVGGIGARVGLECAGDVEAVGSQVSGFRPGDRVMAAAPGGHAEFVAVHAGRVLPIPMQGLTYEQAACLPTALQTLHNAIVTRGRLASGESLVVVGASSAVGLMGLQIGKLLGASPVIGTSTSPTRRARLKDYGCDVAVDTADPTWPEEVRKATADRGANLIVDMVAGPTVNQSMEAAAILARIVNVGRLGGKSGDFNFDLHALKRIEYIGVTNRTRSQEELNEVTRRMHADLWPAVEAGTLALPIDTTFPFDQVAEALARMTQNQHFGKIVLTMA